MQKNQKTLFIGLENILIALRSFFTMSRRYSYVPVQENPVQRPTDRRNGML